LPSRLPLFSRDGKTALDQSHCRFGLYPDGLELIFTDGYGYRPPLEVEISTRTLSIAGSELKRHFAAMWEESLRDMGGGRRAAASSEHVIVDIDVADVNVHVAPSSPEEAEQESAGLGSPVTCDPQVEPVAPMAARDAHQVQRAGYDLPEGAPPGVAKMLELANRAWVGKYDGKNWEKYQRINQKLLDLNDDRGIDGKGSIARTCCITNSEWKTAIAIIRPAWSIRNSSDSLKDSHETHITPELNAMISVAWKIHEAQRIGEVPVDELTISGWLDDQLVGRPRRAHKTAVLIKLLMAKSL
jgi:hypothetical protein